MTRMFPFSTRQILSALALAGSILALALGLHLMFYVGIAHADVVSDAPIVVAQSTTDTGWTMVTQYGPLWAAVLLLFAGLKTFLSRQHWLAQGRMLALLTGASMVGGAFLDWHFNGAPVAGILVTAFAAISLIVHPTVAPAAAKTESGKATMALLIVVAMAGGATLIATNGCATGKAVAVAAGNAVVDCTKESGPDIAALVASLGSQATLSALKLGHVDWSALESAALAQGKTIGGCAFVRVLVAMSSTGVKPSTQSLAAGTDLAGDAQIELEHFRAAAGGGQWLIDGQVR